MEYKRLEQSLIDIVKEEQAKLGYRKEDVRLYYPLSTLNHFFDTEDTVEEMAERLTTFTGRYESKTWRNCCNT